MAETMAENNVVLSEGHPQPEPAAGSPKLTSSPPVTKRSPSPSPPLTDTTTEPTVTAERESPIDPRVVALRAMFPDYDDTILQSVLESVQWDQDRAVDSLLVMSDPEYIPESPPPQQTQQPETTQEELDEQFARQLLLQDEQRMSARTANRLQAPPPGPYQPWGHPGQPEIPPQQYPQQLPRQQAGPGQGMAEFQEQFNKFAETGKKTLGTFFSKVKTKFQEFEQGRPSDQQPGAQYQWTPGSSSYYAPPHQPPPGFQYAGPSPTIAPPLPASGPSSSPSVNQIPTSETPPTVGPLTSTGSPVTSSAAPIDAGKLGLLPKRPVSLIRDDDPIVPAKTTAAEVSSSTTAPVSTAKGYNVDDDDLEYTESPFEDPVRK